MVTFACAGEFIVDPTYTTIHHRIKHLAGWNVGVFDTFEGELRFDRKNERLKRLELSIDATSVNTYNEMRDAHLRGEDFFYTEKYPEIRFRSKKITDKEIHGQLEMRGERQNVTLTYKYWGTAKDQFGREKVSLTLRGRVKRADFGMDYNQEVPGGKLLGDEVEIYIELSGLDAKAAKK